MGRCPQDKGEETIKLKCSNRRPRRRGRRLEPILNPNILLGNVLSEYWAVSEVKIAYYPRQHSRKTIRNLPATLCVGACFRNLCYAMMSDGLSFALILTFSQREKGLSPLSPWERAEGEGSPKVCQKFFYNASGSPFVFRLLTICVILKLCCNFLV